jgi:hypothetical protein
MEQKCAGVAVNYPNTWEWSRIPKAFERAIKTNLEVAHLHFAAKRSFTFRVVKEELLCNWNL